jgi:acetoacetyl-CoA synthetase
MNPSGVRFGSSEIYSILEKSFTQQILDSLCVGQQRPSDQNEHVILFVKLAPFYAGKLYPNLAKKIRAQISIDLTRRHAPRYIFEVDKIPYNANGKKLEIPVKLAICRGPGAVEKAKVTAAEAQLLRQYEKYYEVEKLIATRSEGARL